MLGLDEFHDPEISRRPRGVTEVCDRTQDWSEFAKGCMMGTWNQGLSGHVTRLRTGQSLSRDQSLTAKDWSLKSKDWSLSA